MEERELWRRLGEAFAAVFGEPIELTPQTTAEDVYGWDSVRHVELLVAIERAFGIRFTTGEVATLESVGELADLVSQRTTVG
jgi:acyl carrier protein